jgi:hypothetical protein
MKDEEAAFDKGGGGLNIGGIIGGIIGSIVVIAVATYLAWRFYIKPKRSQTPTSINVEYMDPVQSPEKNAALGGTRPPSTHTVHSIAPTILTRASNIIQIAYIPGVTNRATPTSPNLLVPLVPLIPMHHAEAIGTTTHTFLFLATSKTRSTRVYLATQTEPRTLAPLTHLCLILLSFQDFTMIIRPAFTAKYGALHNSTAPQRSLLRQSNRRLHSELS